MYWGAVRLAEISKFHCIETQTLYLIIITMFTSYLFFSLIVSLHKKIYSIWLVAAALRPTNQIIFVLSARSILIVMESRPLASNDFQSSPHSLTLSDTLPMPFVLRKNCFKMVGTDSFLHCEHWHCFPLLLFHFSFFFCFFDSLLFIQTNYLSDNIYFVRMKRQQPFFNNTKEMEKLEVKMNNIERQW